MNGTLRMTLPRTPEAQAALRTAAAKPAPRPAEAIARVAPRAGASREWRLPNGAPPPLVLWGDEK